MQAFTNSFNTWHFTKHCLQKCLPFRAYPKLAQPRINSPVYIAQPLQPYCCTTPSNFPQTSPGRIQTSGSSFEILDEKTLFHRYQTVYQRDVRYPDGTIVSYDILGTPHTDFKSVFVFPYHTATRTVTMLREYAPGQNSIHPAFVAGMYEPAKHASLVDAAVKELSEEAQLKGGRLIPLSQACTPADKYSRNEFWFFLAVDCVKDTQPAQRDAEEWIEIVQDVSLEEVRNLVNEGRLNTPHSLLAMLALDKIQNTQLNSSPHQ